MTAGAGGVGKAPLPDRGDAEAAAPPAESAPPPGQRAWAWLRGMAPWVLSLLVLALIASRARTIEWPGVWQALRTQPRAGLAIAVASALLSYAVFASYDLIGRHVTGHRVPLPRTLGIAATCYAFNLNFGSLVGALALKLRLYARAGMQTATTLQVIGLSVLTNWLGYLAVGGAVMVLAPPPLPARWPLAETGVRILGAAMLASVAVYLLWCARGGKAGRTFAWRGRSLPLPDGRVALWQLAVAVANWALMGAIVWILLGQRVGYATALGVLLLAAIAGVITHVPAGLGVLEAVFLACLQGQIAEGSLLAALLTYRASYYLLPLAMATVGYFVQETAGRRRIAA